MKINTFQNEKEFIDKTVKFIEDICLNSNTGESIKIALSGGSTPQPIYKALSQKKLSFNTIEFFQIDERYVPEDHTDSNCRMIYTTLLKDIKPFKFHYFQTSLPIEEALKKYQSEVQNIQFDLSILGIGLDGHTASLFPHTKAIKETNSSVAHTQTNEFAIKDRLTLTFPKILESKKILILLKGLEKETIIEKIQNPSIKLEDFPAKKLATHKDLTINLLVQ